jgi:hypothetical protein
MKKITLALAVLTIAIAFVSCQKKTYTCECIDIAGRHQFDIKKSSQKAAQRKCESYTDHPELDGPSCSLKN